MRSLLLFVCVLFIGGTYAYADEEFEQEGMFDEGHDVVEEYGQPLKSGLQEPSAAAETKSLDNELGREPEGSQTKVPEPIVPKSKLYGATVHKESELRQPAKAKKSLRKVAKKHKASKTSRIAKAKKHGKTGRSIASVHSKVHKKNANRKYAKRGSGHSRVIRQ